MHGVLRRGSVLERPELAVRCTPVTSRQWCAAFHDSGLPILCDRLDSAAASLLDVRKNSARQAGRRLPGLVVNLATAHKNLQRVAGDLGRFHPPDIDLALARCIADTSQLCYKYAAAALECAAGGFDTAALTLAGELREQLERMVSALQVVDCAHDVEPEGDLRFERALGLSTATMSAGDGLTYASRVAAAWDQHPELDERLRAELPHLLDPAIPLQDTVRRHLAHLLVSDRPLVAHQAAVAARDLVLRALSSDQSAALDAIAEEVLDQPFGYSVHRHVVSAARAFDQVSEPADQLRFVMQMYLSVAEGDIARVSRLTLQLLGRQVAPATTLGPLLQTLTAMHGEPMCALLSSSVNLAWRNAIAHGRGRWDSMHQSALLENEHVDLYAICDEALRAHAICEGFEAGVAVALNQTGNPHESENAPVDEIGLMIRIGQTLGAAGLPVSKLDQEGTTVRPLIPPLTILTMDKLHAALIQIALHGGGALNWDIRQPVDRPPYRISAEAIDAVLALRDTSSIGESVLEFPISGLPMILSGLLAHDPGSASIIPCLIALAAVNIIGERERLTAKLAVGDAAARTSLLRTIKRTARAVDAAAVLANHDQKAHLLAFARLITKAGQDFPAGSVPDVTSMQPLELALRSSAPARIPWLDDAVRPPQP
jgi:hypothetical protein